MRKIVLFALIFLSAQVWGSEKDISFSTTAPETVVVGEQFRLSYTINTQNAKDLKFSPGNEFDVLYGPATTYSSVTINGNSSETLKFTYTLVANKVGEFTIPGASVVAGGKKIVSEPTNIKVLPQDQKNDAAQSPNQTERSVSSEDLFITATVSKSKVYEQEALLLTYKIYTRDPSMQLTHKLPDFKGFHSQEIELPANMKWEQEHYKGRNYFTTIFRQFVLSPQQSGKLVIEPAQFQVMIRKVVPSADPFDAFFNGGNNIVNLNKNVSTTPITINVLPLPKGKPADFSGGVGDFTITSSINNKELKTNDAVTIKLVISGTGNIKLMSDPEIEFPEDFEQYDPKVDYRVRLTKNGLTGNKIIEYLAIPRHAGHYKIPGVSFSYFDLKSKSYKTLKTEDYTINVEKGAGNADQAISNFTNKEDLKILGEDIRFINSKEIKLHPKGYFFYGSIGYWLFYIVSALSFVFLLLLYHKRIKANANVARVRTKQANKVAIKRMKLAGKLLSENKKDAFYDEVLKALWGYVSDKLNIPVSDLSKENIAERLKEHNITDELIQQFINTLNECEFERFAPGNESLVAMDKIYASSVDIIRKMESLLKN